MHREQLFHSVEGSVTRGHKLKVRGGKFRGDLRKNFFYSEGGDGLECTAWEGGGGGMPHIL